MRNGLKSKTKCIINGAPPASIVRNPCLPGIYAMEKIQISTVVPAILENLVLQAIEVNIKFIFWSK